MDHCKRPAAGSCGLFPADEREWFKPSGIIARLRDDFNKDTKSNLAKVEANWLGLVDKKGK